MPPTRPASCSHFVASFKGDPENAEKIEGAQFPLDVDDYPGLTIRWRRDIDETAQASGR
jgi:hypothetical protein